MTHKPSTPPPQPILVTGAHRTGTTWVGKMLTASDEAVYISEPTNVLHRPGVLRIPIQHWYPYICKQNQHTYLPALQDTLRFRYHLFAEIRALRSRKDFLRMIRDGSTFLNGWLRRKRPLLKDPFAVFSAPWYAQQFNCQVVITIRHPAAFASSLKRLNWPFDFDDLLAQPLLMQDWLEPYRLEMQKMDKQDIIGQASLLWRLVYQTVTEFQKNFPKFQVVRHEDLSLNPIQDYRTLYANLGLQFSPQAQATILNSSSSDNPKEVSKNNIYATRLDSQANLHNWKSRLSPDEISRVRQLTEELAAHYYPDQSWS